MNYGDEQLKLIEEITQTLDNITLEYKNEENKVTIAITGLDNIVLAETVDTKHVIRLPDGKRVEISLGVHTWWGMDNHYINVERFISLPKIWEKEAEMIMKQDRIEIPVLKKLNLEPVSQYIKRRILWNVLSVSAETKNNTYFVTFTIDPQTGGYYDTTWE